MQAIKNKLRSRRGASLTFALLLFLVCAVIGSVVLTAGTAASGRMSQIAEMDQRYYSVHSAASLLVDMMEKASVRVEKTVYTADPTKSDEYKYFEKDGDKEKEVEDIPTQFTSIAMEAAYRITKNENIGRANTYTLEPSVGSGSLKVTVKETLVPDGSILFEIENADTASNHYVVDVRLAAKKQEKHELITAENKERITTTLSWELSDVQTVWTAPTAGG